MALQNTALHKHPLALIAPFFLWGTAMVTMKGAMPHTAPLFVATLRLLPAGLLVLAAAWAMGRPAVVGWRAWLWVLLFALVDGALFQGFLALGLVRTGAGLGSVMIDSQPIAVALLARILFQERIGAWGAVGLALGVGGISLLGLPDSWFTAGWAALRSGHEIAALPATGPGLLADWPDLVERLLGSGEWLMLLAALSMAVGTVLVRYVSRHCDPVMATGWHMVLAGVVIGGLSLWQEASPWQQLTPSDWLGLGYASIFGSAIAYGLFFYFASSRDLTSFTALTFLTPVFALLFGNLFLQERLTAIQWGGVLITLVSIYIVNQRQALAGWILSQASVPEESATDSGHG